MLDASIVATVAPWNATRARIMLCETRWLPCCEDLFFEFFFFFPSKKRLRERENDLWFLLVSFLYSLRLSSNPERQKKGGDALEIPTSGRRQLSPEQDAAFFFLLFGSRRQRRRQNLFFFSPSASASLAFFFFFAKKKNLFYLSERDEAGDEHPGGRERACFFFFSWG